MGLIVLGFCFVSQFSQPPLRITARPKKVISRVQVIRLRVASALRALVNIEPPLEAIPPMPSPLGLCSNTEMIKKMPLADQT